MRGPADLQAITKVASKLDAAANVLASISVAPGTEEFVVVDTVQVSYAGGTPSGLLTLNFVAGAQWVVQLEAEGEWDIQFPRGFYTGVKDQTMQVLLSAGGVGTTGKVNILYR